MRVLTRIELSGDQLEVYRPVDPGSRWELVISGHWSESPFHSGHIAYYVHKASPGTWVLNAIERNADLDDVTEEDVRKGRLNDDQRQAMWGMTLEEAQNQCSERIVAVLLDAPKTFSSLHAASRLYHAWVEASGKEVEEPDDDGLLDGISVDDRPASRKLAQPKRKAKQGPSSTRGRKK